MIINYQSDYLSVKRFAPVTLPSLTILTGVNGSGKSHFLKSIELKHSLIQGRDNPHVVYFNYENFKLDSESAFLSHQIESELQNCWNYYTQQVQNNIVSWKQNILPHNELLKEKASELKTPLWFLSAEQVDSPEAYEALKRYKRDIGHWFRIDNQKKNQQAQAVFTLIKKLTYPIDEISEEDFFNYCKPYTYKNDFLPQQLGKIIWGYYLQYKQNVVNRHENIVEGKDVPFLTDEEFYAKYGEKPWEVMNEILMSFGSLDYKVLSPEGKNMFGSYQLQLVHKDNPELEINFDALSSGEKILMSLVASIYKSSSDNHFPDVLLLDEVDASLHPSMIKNLLEVVSDIFLARNTDVIIVTHSPTTVALADEESIFLMNKTGEQRVVKSSKAEALNVLSEGFVSLTTEEAGQDIQMRIGQNNKPVLFVEGVTDKKILEVAWKKLNPTEEMPFVIENAYDCFFVKNLLAREEIFINEPTRTFVGMLDFDSAVKAWKDLRDSRNYGVSNFDEHTLKHVSEKGYLTLLPVPPHRENYASLDFSTSHLSIELLFRDEVVGQYCSAEAGAGGVEFLKFKDSKKSDFANSCADLDVSAFTEFEAVFIKVVSCIEDSST
jgi:ABC-type iron transport system FetAB ATPase subunit